MPELPEVETAARSLRPFMRDKRIVGFEVVDTARLVVPAPSRMVGRVVHNVRRIGKQVVVELDPAPSAGGASHGERLWLAVHLRMTGRLLAVGAAANGSPHDATTCAPADVAAVRKHLRARWRLSSGHEVWFVDPRRFGTVRLHEQRHELTPAGIEPLGAGFTAARLAARLVGSATPIKPWLLRQDRIVGLGNIYACEILFEAGLSPLRAAGTLQQEEVERLRTATRDVLRRAIRHCGTTFSDFQDSRGSIGSYQQYLYVYGREGKPCHVCGTTILRVLQAGRSTFYCPKCQRVRAARVPRRAR